ncbi:MAG: RNA polymerase sigma-70 factor [Gemmatimonadaceae bacterium]
MTSASDPLSNASPDLAPRIRAGEAAAFEELFRIHYAGLCRFAHRYLGDASLAEDLVQDLFADLWAEHPRLALRGSARAYLFTAVRNRALNFRKHQMVEHDWERNEALPDVRELHRPPAGADEALDVAERDARLHAAIEALPERCRLVMQLRWREQLSYAEIAEVMSISLKGVENQLARGLQALRQRLGIRFPR